MTNTNPTIKENKASKSQEVNTAHPSKQTWMARLGEESSSPLQPHPTIADDAIQSRRVAESRILVAMAESAQTRVEEYAEHTW